MKITLPTFLVRSSHYISLTLKTGLPAGSYKPVFIPKVAEGSFSKVPPIAPYTSWQRLMGHQYTPRGTLNLKTGEFNKTGVNWSQIKNYGADIFLLNPAIDWYRIYFVEKSTRLIGSVYKTWILTQTHVCLDINLHHQR